MSLFTQLFKMNGTFYIVNDVDKNFDNGSNLKILTRAIYFIKQTQQFEQALWKIRKVHGDHNDAMKNTLWVF